MKYDEEKKTNERNYKYRWIEELRVLFSCLTTKWKQCLLPFFLVFFSGYFFSAFHSIILFSSKRLAIITELVLGIVSSSIKKKWHEKFEESIFSQSVHITVQITSFNNCWVGKRKHANKHRKQHVLKYGWKLWIFRWKNHFHDKHNGKMQRKSQKIRLIKSRYSDVVVFVCKWKLFFSTNFCCVRRAKPQHINGTAHKNSLQNTLWLSNWNIGFAYKNDKRICIYIHFTHSPKIAHKILLLYI